MPSTSVKTNPQLPALGAWFVCAISLFYGASALVLEWSWTRQLESLLGTDPWFTATTLAVCLLGLGAGMRLGVALARRDVSPLRVFAVLQVIVSAWALVVPLLIRALQALLPTIGAGVSTGVAGLLIVLGPPSILLGAALPLLALAISTRNAGFATRFSSLYGSTVLGAAAGAGATVFVLLPEFGTTRTILYAVVLHLGAAAGAFLVSLVVWKKPRPAKAAGDGAASKRTPSAALLTVLAAAAGFLALGLSILWTRSLLPVLGSTTYSLASVLTVFLAGLALGPLLIGWLAGRGNSPGRVPAIAGLCFLGAGVTIVLSVNLIGDLPARFFSDLSADDLAWDEVAASRFVHLARLVLAPAIFLGALLPVTATGFHFLAARRSDGGKPETVSAADATARAGRATAIGAVAGVLLVSLVALPHISLYHALLGAGGICILIALTCLTLLGYAPRIRILVPVLTIFLALVWVVFQEPWDDKKSALGAYFQPGTHTEAGRVQYEEVLKTSRLLVHEAGITSTISVLGSHENTLRFMSDGKVVTQSTRRAVIDGRLLGHLPMILHPGEPERVLQLGLDAGITAGALGRHPALSAFDVVETEPGAVHAAESFSAHNHDVLNHPGISVHFTGARRFLLATEAEYDVICSKPPDPAVAAATRLFTKEFFELARRRLAADGVFCQWIPVQDVSQEDFGALLGTFVAVFPQSLCFATGTDSILIGFNDRVRIDPEKAGLRLRIPDVAASLADIGFTHPEHLWGLLVADLAATPPRRPPRLVTDDHPFVEFTAPRSAIEESTQLGRQLQLDLFEKGIENLAESTFTAAFSEENRDAIASQRSAVRDALRAGFELAQGNTQSALDHSAEASERTPVNPIVLDEVAEVYSTVGNSLLRQGNLERAVQLLQQAHEYQPGVFKHLYRLSLGFLRSGEPAQAAALLAEGIKGFPDSPFFYSLHGSLSLEAGNLRDALAFHEVAVEKAPRLTHLWEQYERTAQIGGDDALVKKIQDRRRQFTE